jgi:hypothetical protein
MSSRALWPLTIAASDARSLEAQKLRQSVLFAHANQPGLDRDVRAVMAEAAAMGQGRGIGALAEDLSCARPPRMSKPVLA